MSYKDILPQLGLPDDLNKRLEELLSLEKDKERKGEGTFNPGLKEINAARKQFRKAYRKIRKHSPSKMGNEKKTSDCEEELNDSISSSESDDSDLVEITHPDDDMMKRLPGVLSKEQEKKLEKESDRMKYLENSYLEKQQKLEKALKELEDDDKVDGDLLKSITSELDMEMNGYNFEAENEELDKIIKELTEMTKELPQENGKIGEMAD